MNIECCQINNSWKVVVDVSISTKFTASCGLGSSYRNHGRLFQRFGTSNDAMCVCVKKFRFWCHPYMTPCNFKFQITTKLWWSRSLWVLIMSRHRKSNISTELDQIFYNQYFLKNSSYIINELNRNVWHYLYTCIWINVVIRGWLLIEIFQPSTVWF